MLGNECPKAFPVRNFVTTPLLIVPRGSAVPSFHFTLQPQVECIATDMKHLAHIRFAFTTFDRCNRFAAQVLAVGGRHRRSSLH